jgi:hypothetical protein
MKKSKEKNGYDIVYKPTSDEHTERTQRRWIYWIYINTLKCESQRPCEGRGFEGRERAREEKA